MSLYSLPKFNLSKGNNLKSFIVLSVILSLIAGFIGGASGFYYMSQSYSLKAEPGMYLPQNSQEQKIIEITREVAPAVASIIISKDVPVYEQYMQEYQDPFFGQLFEIPQQRLKGTKKQEVGGGTGVIVSSDGIVLTNKHVVSDKEAEYTVFTNDGKKYPAKVMALDPVQDLAIIKIEQTGLPVSFPTVKLGDSDKIQQGQTAITIGNALGEFKNTVSAGIVSGLSRTITASGGGTDETLEDIIQTDAAINQGNSGGPLINLNGEVIGINTAMVQSAQSIGFAIPINKAKRDIDQVKATGKISYPFLGVRYVLITDEVKTKYNLSVDYGAYIMKGDNGEPAVSAGSSAEKAGIKEGDVILELNNEKISSDNSLAKLISKHKPGDKVSIKYLRDGKESVVDAVLTERTE